MKYFDELKRSMDMLALEPNTIFLGQAVAYAGTAMTNTLKDVPEEKKLEFPVAEEMQMGASIGLAMNGFIPISIYPRWNFLLLAANQLINHLDKIRLMSDYKPGVIVRTSVGSERPLFPGHQHVGNFKDAFKKLTVGSVYIWEVKDTADIFDCYSNALKLAKSGFSTVIVEYGDYYNEK